MDKLVVLKFEDLKECLTKNLLGKENMIGSYFAKFNRSFFVRWTRRPGTTSRIPRLGDKETLYACSLIIGETYRQLNRFSRMRETARPVLPAVSSVHSSFPPVYASLNQFRHLPGDPLTVIRHFLPVLGTELVFIALLRSSFSSCSSAPALPIAVRRLVIDFQFYKGEIAT